MITPGNIRTAKDVNLIDVASMDGYDGTRNYDHMKICCVFHNEQEPSLAIYEDHYYCYSCGEYGDTISWIMKTRDADFQQAVEYLLSII